jgi:hypothetical protein
MTTEEHLKNWKNVLKQDHLLRDIQSNEFDENVVALMCAFPEKLMV